MPELHNPTSQDLYSEVVADIVAAGESREISDEQAARVNTASGVWRIHAPAVREQVKRGAKRAEIDTAPVMEKRG